MTYVLIIIVMLGGGTTSQQVSDYSSKETCEQAGHDAESQLSPDGRISQSVRFVCVERHQL